MLLTVAILMGVRLSFPFNWYKVARTLSYLGSVAWESLWVKEARSSWQWLKKQSTKYIELEKHQYAGVNWDHRNGLITAIYCALLDSIRIKGKQTLLSYVL